MFEFKNIFFHYIFTALVEKNVKSNMFLQKSEEPGAKLP